MTTTRVRLAFCAFVLFGLTSCTPRIVPEPAADHAAGKIDDKTAGQQAEVLSRDQITQISVVNALMLGDYDGIMSIKDMLGYGDFGLGTLDHLDGELIVVDGTAYQARGDGSVVEVDPARTTPFAVVTKLQPDGQFRCDSLASLADLDQLLDDKIEHANNFIAIRVDGQFASITVRSVQRQEPPYKPLAQVAKSQGVWTHHDLGGTLVGIRCPAWVHGLNVPGFHWHFISDDRQVGGHVLACHIRHAHIRYDICTNWLVKLPNTQSFNALDLNTDLRTELKQVERSREGGGEQ